MPSIEENKQAWTHYHWENEGSEWSSAWGGDDFLWWGTIFPRIQYFVSPDASVLEIAPGFGRCTKYLKDLCRELTLVDLTDRCIQACKRRFSDNSNIKYFVNDGKSLSMIEDYSLDFVFSWDSLVHVEIDVIDAYFEQISKKLKENGIAFIHHSNAGIYNHDMWENKHWRGKTVSANEVEKIAKKYSLQCISQELINWSDKYLTDCITVITKNGSKFSRDNRIFENVNFMNEAKKLQDLARLYQPAYVGAGKNQKRVSNQLQEAMSKKIYLWGVGSLGISCLNYLKRNNIPIEGILDSDGSKWGNAINEVMVTNSRELLSKFSSKYYIIICSSYENEITEVLHEYNLTKDQDYCFHYECFLD